MYEITYSKSHLLGVGGGEKVFVKARGPKGANRKDWFSMNNWCVKMNLTSIVRESSDGESRAHSLACSHAQSRTQPAREFMKPSPHRSMFSRFGR